MIFEISNCCKEICQPYSFENETLENCQANLQQKIQFLQDNLKDFDFWFKTQFNSEELLVSFIYTQLLEVRKINKVVQHKQFNEKSSQIKGQSIDSQKSQDTQSSICSVMIEFKKFMKRLNRKGAEIMEAFNQSKEDEIAQMTLQTPTKQYSLDKIYYVINFELNCLKSFDISGEEAAQLQKIEELIELKWILDLMNFKNQYKQLLSCLINSAQELANYQLEDFTRVKEQFLMEGSIKTKEESLGDLLNGSHFSENQNIFNQLIMDKIKKSMAGQEETKKKKNKQQQKAIKQELENKNSNVCMCLIF